MRTLYRDQDLDTINTLKETNKIQAIFVCYSVFFTKEIYLSVFIS